jgi:hypothetical protein
LNKHFPKQSTARRGKASKNARGQNPHNDSPPPVIRCNPALLAPNNSYGTDFMLRGYYADKVFCCVDCGKNEIWSATQQKWWYEIAKGNVNSTATRCRACRRLQRERTNEARRVQREGSARKRGV